MFFVEKQLRVNSIYTNKINGLELGLSSSGDGSGDTGSTGTTGATGATGANGVFDNNTLSVFSNFGISLPNFGKPL